MMMLVGGIFVFASINLDRQLEQRRKMRAQQVRFRTLDRLDTATLWASGFGMFVSGLAAVILAVHFAWSH